MDIRKIKKLIELVEESGITELEVQEEEGTVRISRAAPAVAPAVVAVVAAAVVAAVVVVVLPVVAAAPVVAVSAAKTEVAPIDKANNIEYNFFINMSFFWNLGLL